MIKIEIYFNFHYKKHNKFKELNLEKILYLNKNHNKADNELNKNILITSYNFDNKNINN